MKQACLNYNDKKAIKPLSMQVLSIFHNVGNIKLIAFICLSLFLPVFTIFGQTFEIYKGDTVNITDERGLKQGYWYIFNRIKKLPNYEDDQVVEEGVFKDNKKVGIWKGYHNNNEIKYEITYKNGIPNGYAKFYYKNGNLSEEGMWKINNWIGKYKYYYENGQVAYEFNYNSKGNGKREGEQKYFHENGNIMIIGTWQNGQESGKLTEYYANGEVKAEKYYNGGRIDGSKTVVYAKKVIPEPVQDSIVDVNTEDENIVADNDTTKTQPKEDINIVKDDNQNQEIERIEGFQKVVKNGKIVVEGEFVDGKLINGKRYIYDVDFKVLKKTKIYENGKLVNTIYHED